MVKTPNPDTPNTPTDSDENRGTEPQSSRQDAPFEPAIFGIPSGNWFTMPVELMPLHPLIDLKVYLDQDDTSSEALWLVGFEDHDADYNLILVTIPDQESTDWSAVEDIIATTISDESHPLSKWIFCGESLVEYGDELEMAMMDISEDRIGQLSPDYDWNSEGGLD